MFQIDSKSRKSIYLQIVDNIKELIIKGVLETDSKLPSVRELSKQIMVNPNTIQKAYRELEHQGFVYSAKGLGTFVSPVHESVFDEERYREVKERLAEIIREIRFQGMDDDGIENLVREILEEGGEGND